MRVNRKTFSSSDIVFFPGALNTDGLCKRYPSWVRWEVSICLQTDRELKARRDNVDLIASVICFFVFLPSNSDLMRMRRV